MATQGMNAAAQCTSWSTGQPGGPKPAREAKRPFRRHHAVNVPRSTKPEVAAIIGSQNITTLMLRNIPNRYTQQSLLEELDAVGFGGSYDFFYLPMDVHNRTNVGYAFVNLVSAHDAQLFRAAFSQYTFKKILSRKVAGVSFAHVQGLENNMYHFANRAVTQSKDSQYKPLVLIQGQPKEFAEVMAHFESLGDRHTLDSPPHAECFAASSGDASCARKQPAAERPSPRGFTDTVDWGKYGDTPFFAGKHLGRGRGFASNASTVASECDLPYNGSRFLVPEKSPPGLEVSHSDMPLGKSLLWLEPNPQ